MADSSLAIDIDATICVAVDGEGGGIWTLHCKQPAAVYDGERPNDCKVTVSAGDLRAIAERRLNPQRAWLEGKIKIEGDTLQTLKFNRILFDER